MPIDELSLNDYEYKNGWRNAYDRAVGPVWQEDPIPILTQSVAVLHAEGKRRVLEPGCGDGRNTRQLVESGLAVVGMDLSATALQRISDEATAGWSNVPTLVVGDVEVLPSPFPRCSFEAVLCFDVFGQIGQMDAAVSGFHDVLEPNGVFIANLYTPQDVAYGEGEQVGERSFVYDDTLFRFFESEDIEGLFPGFEIEDVLAMRWDDPPHPGYREYPHTHDNLVVRARRK